MDGMERARKKQLVWDPEKGFIGREELELEKLKGKESTNKTEQERMLEVLENISRTPLGETKRGSSTKVGHLFWVKAENCTNSRIC